MGMHIDPVPSGKPEYNANEMTEQNVEREYREAMAEQGAEGQKAKKPGFFSRLFSKKS
jgi:hypothetical protein